MWPGFSLPLATCAPASLARIRPCLSLRCRIFTFGNRDMYASSFSLRYSVEKERMRLHRAQHLPATGFERLQGQSICRGSLLLPLGESSAEYGSP